MYCFSKTGLCIYFSSIFPENCGRICATKLSNFTFTHNGLASNSFSFMFFVAQCMGSDSKNMQTDFRGIIELLLYTIKSPDFLLSIDQRRSGFLIFFRHNYGNQKKESNTLNGIQTERKLSKQKGTSCLYSF